MTWSHRFANKTYNNTIQVVKWIYFHRINFNIKILVRTTSTLKQQQQQPSVAAGKMFCYFQWKFAWKNGIKYPVGIYFHPSHQNNLFTFWNLWRKRTMEMVKFFINRKYCNLSSNFIYLFYFFSLDIESYNSMYFGENLRKVEKNYISIFLLWQAFSFPYETLLIQSSIIKVSE